MPTFVFNDETVINSYGFRVLNRGGQFARFDANPVMLNDHINKTETTLGNWKNRKVEGAQLKGDTNFDNARDSVKEVEGQVNRGFLKGCSMGLAFSFDENSWQKAPDGVWELVAWELLEVSICAVPSNSNSLALYNINTGKLIPENEFKLNLNALSSTPFQRLTNNGFLNNSQILTLKDFMKLSNDAKLDFKNNNPEAYAALFDKSESVKSIKRTADLTNVEPYTPGTIKTIEDFQKLTNAQMLHFKSNNEAAYMALFGLGIGAFGSHKGINPPKQQHQVLSHPTVKSSHDFLRLTHSAQHQFKKDYPDVYDSFFNPLKNR